MQTHLSFPCINKALLKRDRPYLLCVGSPKEGHDLRTDAVIIRAEQTTANAGRHTVSRRPGDRVGIIAVGRNVAELRLAVRLGAQRAGEERHRLRSRAGGVGRECSLAGAGGDAVLNVPRDRLGVLAACRHIGHAGDAALRRGRACGAPQERDDLRAGAGLVRSK